MLFRSTPGLLTAQNAIAVNPLTPTVTEFLNAAISEYVIGGVPDGMKAFAVGGQQLSYYDTLTGAVAHTWITAENQVLISFAGTTGGENLLLNPLLTPAGCSATCRSSPGRSRPHRLNRWPSPRP